MFNVGECPSLNMHIEKVEQHRLFRATSYLKVHDIDLFAITRLLFHGSIPNITFYSY